MPPKIAICVPRVPGTPYPYAQCGACSRSVYVVEWLRMTMQHPPALDKQGECPSRLANDKDHE